MSVRQTCSWWRLTWEQGTLLHCSLQSWWQQSALSNTVSATRCAMLEAVYGMTRLVCAAVCVQHLACLPPSDTCNHCAAAHCQGVVP